METLHIVVGTVTGTAQGIADFIKKKLSDNYSIIVHEYPDLDEILDAEHSRIVFCVSNTGVGELPPRMRKVFVQLTEQDRDLSHYHYWLINLGDSSFKTYGQSGLLLDKALKACGAKNNDEILTIDAMHERYPKKAALEWLQARLNNT